MTKYYFRYLTKGNNLAYFIAKLSYIYISRILLLEGYNLKTILYISKYTNKNLIICNFYEKKYYLFRYFTIKAII